MQLVFLYLHMPVQVKGLAEEDMEGAWSRGVALTVERDKVLVRYLEVCHQSQ